MLTISIICNILMVMIVIIIAFKKTKPYKPEVIEKIFQDGLTRSFFKLNHEIKLIQFVLNASKSSAKDRLKNYYKTNKSQLGFKIEE